MRMYIVWLVEYYVRIMNFVKVMSLSKVQDPQLQADVCTVKHNLKGSVYWKHTKTPI